MPAKGKERPFQNSSEMKKGLGGFQECRLSAHDRQAGRQAEWGGRKLKRQGQITKDLCAAFSGRELREK